MQILPENHNDGGKHVPITVEQADEPGGVLLSLEACPMETIDDRTFWRELTPDEADELAAALKHHAQQSRRWSQ